MILQRILLIFAIIILNEIYARIEFNNVNCIARDSTYLSFEYCYLRSVNRTYKYCSVKCHLKQSFLTHTLLTFKIVKRDSKHIFEQYNATIDICKYMKDRKNVLANMVLGTFLDYTNLNHTCPFKDDIYLEKLPVQHVNSMIRFILPDGRYYLNLTWIINNIPRADVVVYFTKS